MNLYEILQNPDRVGEGMTHFERLFAQKVGGGWSETTITGTPPIYFKSNGAPLTDYRISGNSYQDGTPSPDNPVEVVGCGVRTENLFDGSYLPYGIMSNDGAIFESSGRFAFYIPVESNTSYTISRIIGASTYFYYGFTDTVPTAGVRCVLFGNIGPDVTTITLTNRNHKYLVFFFGAGKSENVMLNRGPAPLPYEPYGYKIPITCGGTEYPIYLGQVPTTRRIKKLVLTGTESFYSWDNGLIYIFISDGNGTEGVVTSRCTHFVSEANMRYASRLQANGCAFRSQYNQYAIKPVSGQYADIDAFKAWLQQQYANGTPVTIMYVLANPQTGIVNEPLHKIGDYADTISMAQASITISTTAGANTLSVGTTVQPSSVSITGHIKPTGYGNLTDVNGVNILDKDGVQIKVHGQ